MEKKTMDGKELNDRKNIVYSSYYCVVSFMVSLAYLVVDVFIDGRLLSYIAVTLLIILISLCGIGIKKLRKELEANNPKAVKWQDMLSKAAEKAGYLSYPFMAISLLIAIVANL